MTHYSRTLFLFVFFCFFIVLSACSTHVEPGPSQPVVESEELPEAVFDNAAVADESPIDIGIDEELPPEDIIAVKDPEPLTEEEQRALESEPEIELAFGLDDQERKEVQLHFANLTHRHRETLVKWLRRSEQYLGHVRQVFREKGLPEELIYLPFVESGYNPRAYSRAGASGMWQFMPATGRKFGLRYDWWIDERRDPYKATQAAAAYLQRLYDEFDDWYFALAAYNAGEGKIRRAVRALDARDFFELTEKNHRLRYRSRLRRETRNYVPKFLAILKIIRNLEPLGFETIDETNTIKLATVQVRGGTDLLALCKAIDMPWSLFHRYNRAFRRYVSHPDMESPVYLPIEKVADAEAFLKSPKSVPYSGYRVYAIRSGDSWYRLSRLYNVPVSVLKRVNNYRSNLIRPGQRVMIPLSSRTAKAVNSHAKTRRIASKRGNYVVARGDTLWDISRTYGVSVNTLLRANGMTSAKRLQIGQKLYIPGQDGGADKAAAVKNALVYRVRHGDTVWDIARRFGVSHRDLLRWNKLSSRSIIRPGDTLYVMRDETP